MDYKGWILSFYDEYVNRCKILSKGNTKIKWKDKFKKMFEKGNRFIGFIVVSYPLSIILIFILGLYYKYSNIELYLFFDTLIIGLILCTQMYKNEISLNEYYYRVNVLRVILIEQNLYNEDFVKYAVKYTDNVFYKLFSNAKKFITSFMTATAFSYVFKIVSSINKSFIVLIIVMFVYGIIFVDCIYMFLIMIPNSRIMRKQSFHELLKILAVYDFNNKSYCKYSVRNTNEIIC